jgi:carboxypeptidase Taq
MDDKVGIDEIPGTWNEKMDKYLGITPPNDAVGCLQDVHWSFGLFGYFATYTLGNLLASQLFDKIRKDIRGLNGKIAKGNFAPLLAWLRKNIHQHGRRYRYLELTKKVTGKNIDEDHFIRYLKKKFGKLFDVRL